jgi:hypothetical protein
MLMDSNDGTRASGLRSNLQRLLQRRLASDLRRGKEQRHSLEGLRFSALMKQMQALQALQGMQELAPRKPGEKARRTFSGDREERARQRQWLEFKADWLEAVLIDTIDEMEAMDEFESSLEKPHDHP